MAFKQGGILGPTSYALTRDLAFFGLIRVIDLLDQQRLLRTYSKPEVF